MIKFSHTIHHWGNPFWDLCLQMTINTVSDMGLVGPVVVLAPLGGGLVTGSGTYSLVGSPLEGVLPENFIKKANEFAI